MAPMQAEAAGLTGAAPASVVGTGESTRRKEGGKQYKERRAKKIHEAV